MCRSAFRQNLRSSLSQPFLLTYITSTHTSPNTLPNCFNAFLANTEVPLLHHYPTATFSSVFSCTLASEIHLSSNGTMINK